MLKYGLGDLLHRRDLRPHELVGIDDDVRSAFLPLLLGNRVERGGNKNDRSHLVFAPESVDKFADLGRILLSAVDHDGICTGFYESKCALQGILHPLLEDQ